MEKNNGHWKVFNSDRLGGVLLTFGSTPSDRHWEKGLLRNIRKAGLDLKPQRTPVSQLELSKRFGDKKERTVVANLSAETAADMGRVVNVRARLRDAVDEFNSHLPGHKGAHAYIARELAKYADSHGMRRWPNANAGTQFIRTLYMPDGPKTPKRFSLWAIELIDVGLVSVPMPEFHGKNKPLTPKGETPEPTPELIGPAEDDPIGGAHWEVPGHTHPAPANGGVDSLEVFYRLVKGKMDIDTAYRTAKTFRDTP